MTRRIALALVGVAIALFGLVAAVAVFREHGTTGQLNWGFFTVAAAFVVAGGSLGAYHVRRNADERRLAETGIEYRGVITSIEREVKSTISGNTQYVLTATAAHGDDTRVFTKVYSGVRPFLDVGQQITIYVDRDNPERFVVAQSR